MDEKLFVMVSAVGRALAAIDARATAARRRRNREEREARGRKGDVL